MVASFASGELVALRAANGNELWNAALSRTSRTNALSEIRDIAGRPVIYKGDVFAVSHSDVMAATDLRTGAARWTLPISAHHHALAGGRRGLSWSASDRPGDLRVARDRPGLLDPRPERAPSHQGKKAKKGKQAPRAIWSSPILASNRLITVSDRRRGGGAERQDRRGGAHA